MQETTRSDMPTVVLVHGAFADASSWGPVIERLQAKGIPVTAPPNPLRGPSFDAAYVASVFQQISGPILAVAHSYGGAVITNAAANAKNVVGLVYVSAFITEEGERIGEAAATSKDSILQPALVARQYPSMTGGKPGVEFLVDPGKFHEAFAADLPEKQAAVMAATQRPLAEAAFTEAAGPAAWKHLPSWAVVGTGDKTIGADLVRSMAQRSGATTVELDGSHVVMISQPQAVTDVIMQAIDAVQPAAVR